jgi:hypothetical protein
VGFFGKPAAPPVTPIKLRGYGVELVPTVPGGVGQLDDGTLIFGPLAIDGVPAGRIRNAIVKPGSAPTKPLARTAIESLTAFSSGEPGTTLIALGADMQDAKGVLEKFGTSDDREPRWSLVARDHAVDLPKRFALKMIGAPRKPYELLYQSMNDHLLKLQGPLTGAKEVPRPDQLAAPEARFGEQGNLEGSGGKVYWFDLSYPHGGAQWRQRWWYLPMGSETVYLLLAQSKADVAAELIAAGETFAASFKSLR